MPSYTVQLPIAGYVSVDVQCGEDEDPIEVALCSDFGTDDIAEWEAYRTLSSGNVLYAPVREATFEQLEEDDG